MIVAVAGLLAALLTGAFLIRRPPPPTTRLVQASQVTDGDITPTVYGEFRNKAHQLADEGGGSAEFLTGSADPATSPEGPFSLEITNADGVPEGDGATRDKAVDTLLDQHLAATVRTENLPPQPGRSLLGLAVGVRSAVSDSKGPNYAWIVSNAMSTIDPEDTRLLLAAADPTQAADDVPPEAIPLMPPNTHLVVVLTDPVGAQGPWSQPVRQWRLKFVTALFARMHPASLKVVESSTNGAAASGAAPAPTVPDIDLDTVVPPVPLKPAAPGTTTVAAVTVDAATTFVADEATFATDLSVVDAVFQPVVTAAADAVRGGYTLDIVATGSCARFGPADGARKLSLARAGSSKAELVRLGVPANWITTAGTGYDDPPHPEDPRSPANRVVAIVATTT